MVVAVTGASGHVGANLVRALLASGRRVRTLVHDDSAALEGLDVERCEGDVRAFEDLERLFAGAEVAYHLAARISIDGDHGGLVTEVNVEGSKNAARAAHEAGVRRFVHFSSVHAFDLERRDGPVDERSPSVGPRHPAYDRSKAAGVRAVFEEVERGLDAVVVYPSGVVGPLDFGPSRMGQVFFNLRERAMPGLVAGGFDWVDVRDVVAGAMAAEASGRAGEGYILSGSYHSVPELAAMAAEISGVAAPRFVSPMWLARLGAPFMTLGNRVFGVEPLYTSEGLSALRGNPEISHAKAARELAYAPRPMLETIAALYRAHAQRELESHVACT